LYHWVKLFPKNSEESNEFEESNGSEKSNEVEESEESEESNKCELIRKAIVIFILNWNFFEGVKTYHNALQMTNKQDKKFEVYFIELEMLNKSIDELDGMDY
jgi:hypothetical protein